MEQKRQIIKKGLRFVSGNSVCFVYVLEKSAPECKHNFRARSQNQNKRQKLKNFKKSILARKLLDFEGK